MNKNATNSELIEIYSSWFIADETKIDKEITPKDIGK